MTPRYPGVEVQLIGQDGNAFLVVGRVARALQEAGVSEEERLTFTATALGGDYDKVLQTAMEWVTVT